MNRAEKKARTRAALLQAARERFSEDGYDGATIRAIAAAAGVSTGSVHAHFPDKRALLLTCFQEQVDVAVAEGWASLARDAALLDQLVHLAGFLYRSYAVHPALSRVMLQESLFPSSAWTAVFSGQALSFLGQVAGLFRTALERGELQRLPGEGALAARNFFAVYFLTLVAGLAGDPEHPERWLADLRAALAVQLQGLCD